LANITGHNSPNNICVITNEAYADSHMLHMVIGPNGEVAADIRNEFQGVGHFVCCNRSILQNAYLDKELQANYT